MSETLSGISGINAPELVGVWVHDPLDPEGTLRNYPFAEGREETIAPEVSSMLFAGRRDPVLEYGESSVVGLGLSVLVPFGTDHEAGVQWWRDAVEARRAICYRDNRGRLIYCGLGEGLPIVDGRYGTALGISLTRVSYDEAVA